MERRKFLQSAGLITAAAGANIALTSSGLAIPVNKVEYFNGPTKVSSLGILENDLLRVDLFSDASAKISDKKNRQEWNIASVAIQDDGPIEVDQTWQRRDRAMMEQYPARFFGEKRGNVIHYTMIGRQNRIKGHFNCKIFLENDWLRFEVSDVDEGLTSLVFPPPVICDSLVLPIGVGKLIKQSAPNIYQRQFLSFVTHLNMKWIGGLKNDNGWLAIFDYDCNDGGAMLVNSLVSPTWLPSKGKWNSKYSIGYKFTTGGYVGLAKAYRQYAIDKGIFKSLKEKMQANPALKNMLGGRTLSYFEAFPPLRKDQAEEYWYTPQQMALRNMDGLSLDFKHQQVTKSIQYAKNHGFKKGAVIVRGWLNGGYDARHPDVWPPEPMLGSVDELKEIMMQGGDILYGLHDNYQDIYENSPSFPKGVNVIPNGDLMSGGFWAGGQAYILNSRNSVEYARRNWENLGGLNQNLMFIDTAATARWVESYEKGNTLTKTQDKEYRLKLLSFFKEKGMIVGSEEGSDFAIPVVDFFECRHGRAANGESIPLWSLVFHDAVFMSRYNSFEPGTPYPKILEDLLWGYQLQFFMTTSFGNIKPGQSSERIGFGANDFSEDLFKSTFNVDNWHQQVGMAEMLSHRCLTEDFQVEETVFAPGLRIIVNFSNEIRQVEGITVKAHDYHIG
jgi:hypothetical protein